MWKTPKFWYQYESGLNVFLRPFSWLYYLGFRLKKYFVREQRLQVPVICVGNVVAGGAGKTPTTIALSEILQDMGYRPHLLTRGYGGKEAGPHFVCEGDSSALIGDEAILLSKVSPTWVCHNRLQGGRAAIKAGASVLMMDDGLQHFTLCKDLSFLVVDGERGFGNQDLIPAGPLREPLSSILQRVNAIIFVGEDYHNIKNNFGDLPLFTAQVKHFGEAWASLGKKRVLAFSGIAHPAKFFETLRLHGSALIGQRAFPDHHPYTGADLRPLIQRAAESKALLVTTEKDFTRIPLKYRSYMTAMPIKLIFDHPEKIRTFLKEKITPMCEEKGKKTFQNKPDSRLKS